MNLARLESIRSTAVLPEDRATVPVIAEAIGLLRKHVNCTCGFRWGKHERGCDKLKAASLATEAEAITRRRQRRLLSFFGLFPWLFVALPASGQVAVDTVTVLVEGLLTEAEITFPAPKIRVGDTIVFRARATDADGDPVTAIFTWASTNPAVLEIVQVSDSIAIGVGRGKGQADVALLAEQFDFLAIVHRMPDGSFRLGRGVVDYRGASLACAFALRGATVVATSAPECLEYVQGLPRGPAYAVWRGPERWEHWARYRLREGKG